MEGKATISPKPRPMFSAPRITNALPANAEVHLRLKWQRLFGVPVPAPRITVDNRHSRR